MFIRKTVRYTYRLIQNVRFCSLNKSYLRKLEEMITVTHEDRFMKIFQIRSSSAL